MAKMLGTLCVFLTYVSGLSYVIHQQIIFSSQPRVRNPIALSRLVPTAVGKGAALAKPKVKLGVDITTPQKQPEQKQQVKKRVLKDRKEEVQNENKSDDLPMYNVILLGDEEYDKAYVVNSLTQIMDFVKRDKAEETFQEAQEHGTSIAAVVPEESAEFYVQQLTRCDPMIFATMEPEKAE